MKLSHLYINLKYFTQFLLFYARSDLRHIERADVPHVVPENFIGVNIASNKNEDTDEYILDKIQDLGLKNLRIYFTYEDLNNHKARLLKKLKHFNGSIIVNLSPPPKDAGDISSEHGMMAWKNFINKFFNDFKEIPFAVEIGSTINRPSWTKLSFKSFFMIWASTYSMCRIHKRSIIGPNVTDFEPFINFGIYRYLQSKHQLPDEISNNLFMERTIQPEPYDRRIFLRKYPMLFKFDIYKKSALYKLIANHFNIKSLISPCAFWSKKRVHRLIEQPNLQRSKYVTRYFALLAAKGDFAKVFWGPLICGREGLISNSIKEPNYPNLEQVTYYKEARGKIADFNIKKMYYALRFFNATIPGAKFIKDYSHDTNIHILEFEKSNQQNNIIQDIQLLYHLNDLRNGQYKDHLGNEIEIPNAITENPIFIYWNKSHQPNLIQAPKISNNYFINHDPQHYFFLHDAEWEGLIKAKNKNALYAFLKACHPSKLSSPDKKDSLRLSRNAVWSLDIPNFGKVVIKKPAHIYPHKLYLDRHRPNKSIRAWNGANALLAKGINTASPIAVFSKKNDKTGLENYYICSYSNAYNFNELALHFQSENTFKGLSKRHIFEHCAQFINDMHGRGLFFNDLSAGNIFIKINDNHFDFELIDTGRVKNYFSNLSFQSRKRQRMKDIVRLLNKFDWETRNIFLKYYFQLNNKSLSLLDKLSLINYDVFVEIKRFRKKIQKKLS
ncbi:MAG: hypothetical protein EBW04_05085 [Betaproteobacteria bacterium]|nr:hypothetical protein [Betaproteobacteria bacterium]